MVSTEDSAPILFAEKTSLSTTNEIEMKDVQQECSNGDANEDTQEGSIRSTHSNSPVSVKETSKTNGEVVECIDLDDDEDSKEPPAKRVKTDDVDPSNEKADTKEKEGELNSPEALLNKLEEYVSDAINSNKTVERKVLDALLGAINVQVQREPLSVRKLILDKQLVLPNTISFPPSQEVEMLIEHDPDFPLSKVITKMFGDERPKLSDAEKKERQTLKTNNPAPHMTKLLMDIGQDLVQEATYCDIVHAKNLPETPKNLETYKTVAAQLKPVWEALKKKNEPYKLDLLYCQICGFQTESRIVLQNHRTRTHYKNGKYICAMCPEYDTNEQRLLNHYLDAHMVIATKDEQQAKYPCIICEEDFQFKGLRDQHMRNCKKDYSKVRHIMAPKGADDLLTINRWLWDRPPVDPTILQQQQQAQAQQKKNQLQSAQAAIRKGTMQAQQQGQQALLQQQLQLQQRHQQQLRQLGQQIMQGQSRSMLGNNTLIAAMQQHLQRAAANNNSRNLTASQMSAYKTLANKGTASTLLAAHAQAQAQASLRKAQPSTSPAVNMQKAASSVVGTNGTPAAGSSQMCEICDQNSADKEKYLAHLQVFHSQMKGKSAQDMQQGAPLACSRCRDRFWTYEGLERHLVMAHGLVTNDLLQKAQKKEDGGRCKLCGKQYAFNMLQHLVADHSVKLCSAEIMYSCDVCSFKCSSYHQLETHLSTVHPKGDKDKVENGKKNGDDCITLDD